jgi:hypothetical protein
MGVAEAVGDGGTVAAWIRLSETAGRRRPGFGGGEESGEGDSRQREVGKGRWRSLIQRKGSFRGRPPVAQMSWATTIAVEHEGHADGDSLNL